jgi:hypothetical protein
MNKVAWNIDFSGYNMYFIIVKYIAYFYLCVLFIYFSMFLKVFLMG